MLLQSSITSTVPEKNYVFGIYAGRSATLPESIFLQTTISNHANSALDHYFKQNACRRP